VLRITIAHSTDEIANLRPVWEQFEAAPRYTLFQSFRWNHLAAKIFGDQAGRETPYVVFAETSAGRAIVPAAISAEHQCVTLLGEALFDYRDALSDGDKQALLAAWEQIARLNLPLRFVGLRSDHCNDFWKALAPTDFAGAPCLRRPDITPDAFAQRHWRQVRQMRLLRAAGVELTQTNGSASMLVRWIYLQKARQLAGAPNNLFADPMRVDFMIAAAAMEAGKCEIFCLKHGATVVSCLLTFRDGGVRRFYTTVFDPAWARYSPGMALLYEVARRSLAQGLDVDWMTGERFHKSRLASHVVPLYRVDASADAILCAAQRNGVPSLAA
jgi:CelD/BcsL family acetyltransferase involved in cellulose biosynthesis